MSEDQMKNDYISQLHRHRPRLKNKEVLRQQVLGRIKQEDTKSSGFMLKYNGWVRIAAAVLLFVGVGNYAWQESNTHIMRLRLKAQLELSVPIEKIDSDCHESFRTLLGNIQAAIPGLMTEGKTVHLTITDILYLERTNSPILPEVKHFLSTLKKLYPDKYEKFFRRGELKMSVWQLKHDYRLCQWLN